MATESKWKEMAERTTILRCLVGSQAYGLSLESSDRDERGVCIEDFETFVGLGPEFEQYEFRTAAERTGIKDAKSEPGDLDLTIYGLAKFLRLATYGNPNVVELLFIQDASRLIATAEGLDLQSITSWIVSREAGRRYLGYMEAQKQRLLGERGQKKVNRPELVEKHGYDTKYASHVVRLGLQGVELQETGKVVLPMEGTSRQNIIDIKQGKWSLDQVLQATGDLEQKLKDLIKDGPLQSTPDYLAVERWMQGVYWDTWKRKRFVLTAQGSDLIH